MLTITYNAKKLYINIDLLKSRFKSAVITLFKVSTYILTIAGMVLIIGTAGASDNNSIPFTQIIIQLLQGFLCCGIAWALNFIKLVIE
jgi:hypothetical protein